MSDILHVANAARTRSAGARDVERAKQAIDAICKSPSVMNEVFRRRQYLRVLQLRLDHPGCSLAELGEQLFMTKDAYAGLLRRAFEFAEKKGAEPSHARVVTVRLCPVCRKVARPTRDKNIAFHLDTGRREECLGSGEPYSVTITDAPGEVAS